MVGGWPDEGASPLVGIALAVRFLLELALLAGVVILVWHLADGPWRWVAAIVGVVAVATVWGLFLSPKAAVSLPAVAVLVIEACLFLAVGGGLLAVGFGVPAAIGVAIWILDRAALALLRR